MEKIFAIHKINKELISTLFKELLQVSFKKKEGSDNRKTDKSLEQSPYKTGGCNGICTEAILVSPLGTVPIGTDSKQGSPTILEML